VTDRTFNVLFLCTGNSARSILGEAILRQADSSRFRSFSGGSHPKGAVHPLALDLLKSLGHPVDALRSKSWDEFTSPDAPKLDFIFTVCDDAAEETCPIWLGHPMTTHWGIPDPARVEGTDAEKRLAFADAYRLLSKRILVFINLPLSSLDRQSLKNQLDAIGKT
jgi:arsenate reductase